MSNMDHAWFCPECGLRDALDRGIDTDGTCSSCGGGCCTWSDLKEQLSYMGWHIVTEADKRVLDASRAVHQRWLESYVNIIVPTQADPQAFAWAQAELARRTP